MSLRLVSGYFILTLALGCSSPEADSSPSRSTKKIAQGKHNHIEILNCSYDPTRELYRDINKAFAADYLQKHGADVKVAQSHGGSSSQARAVIDGLQADVVTLSIWSDVDQIRKSKLIDDDWQSRLAHGAAPSYSTIVFVVRKGNLKGIHDWPDLAKPGVEIITPNPLTGGGAKVNFLAAWGSVVTRGGSEEDAKTFLTTLYRQVPVLDSGARGSATTFAQKKIGDVHLAWENEAYREVEELKDELEIVTPPVSIQAPLNVAVVDAVARSRGTEAVAKAYLDFLYSDAGQELFASHHYRPVNEKIAAEHSADFASTKLFQISDIAKNWDDAFQKFFGEGSIYEEINSRLADEK